jgi:capsular polysaccharide biosynthesis protein
MHQELRPEERVPQRIAQAVLKRPWVVLLAVLAFVGPTLGFYLSQPTVYEAAALLLLEENWESDRSGIRLIPLYFPGAAERAVEALDNPAIAKEAIRRLGLSGIEPGELLDNLTTTQEPGTLFIELSYKDANPQRAQRIANTVAEVASERSTQEGPYDYVVRIKVWEEAPLPANPVSPLPAYRNATLVVLGALGLVLGTGLALLLEERAT